MENFLEEKIKIKLKTIKEVLISELTKEFPTVDSIILYGSYGRGEGSWFEENTQLKPYNDYDLLLIFNTSIPKVKDINSIRSNLAKKLNIKWVDLSFATKKSLKKTPNTVYGYDLKYGSSVIYGDSNVIENIPNLQSDKIPLKESSILFFTRLWAFSGTPPQFTDLKIEEARFFKNQMSKALFASLDSILILNGKYHSSYKKRLDIIINNFDKEISCSEKELYRWALKEKLNPSSVKMSKNEVESFYLKVATLYRKRMLNVFSLQYKNKFEKITDFKKFYKSSLLVNLKRVAYILLKRNLRFEKIYWTNIVQLNVLSSILNEIDSTDLICESQVFLKKINISTDENLDKVRYSVAKARETI